MGSTEFHQGQDEGLRDAPWEEFFPNEVPTATQGVTGLPEPAWGEGQPFNAQHQGTVSQPLSLD